MAIHDAYTEAEVNFIEDNYSDMSWDEFLFGINSISPVKRDKQSIIHKASSLGIKRTHAGYARFSKEEDALIEEVYRASDESELTDNILKLIRERVPHRTYKSIQSRASKLGISMRRPWGADDINFLIENYYTMPTYDIADMMGRTHDSIYNMVRKLGLRGAPMSKYTDADAEFVRNHYLVMSDDEIGEVLHRAGQSIKEYRRKLGLYRRDPEADTHYRDIIRFIQSHNADWKKRSMAACGYKCVLTNEAFCDIHHLYAKNMIINTVLERLGLPLDIDINQCSSDDKKNILKEFFTEQDKYPLGVCITADLHHKFHAIYGFGYNTPEQFFEFAERFPQNRLREIIQ